MWARVILCGCFGLQWNVLIIIIMHTLNRPFFMCCYSWTINWSVKIVFTIRLLRRVCTDPESFAIGDPTLPTVFFIVDEGRDEPNTTISGPASAHQQTPLKWRFTVVPLMAQHQTCLPMFFAYFLRFWARKYALRITITELRTRESPNFLAKFLFLLMFCVCNDP